MWNLFDQKNKFLQLHYSDETISLIFRKEMIEESYETTENKQKPSQRSNELFRLIQ